MHLSMFSPQREGGRGVGERAVGIHWGLDQQKYHITREFDSKLRDGTLDTIDWNSRRNYSVNFKAHLGDF